MNENHLCSPHNRQPDRNQCLWIPWCAFHYVLPFCSFCLLAITPMQSVPLCPTPETVSHNSGILCASFLLGNPLIRIILFVQLSSHQCGSSFPTHQMAFYPSAITMFLATALLLATAAPLISPYRAARSQQRHLWVTATIRSSVGGFKWSFPALIAISACGFHGVHSITCFHSVRSACWQSHQCNQCRSTCRPSPSCAFYFCTSEQESLCIPPISHHQRNQCLYGSSLCIPPTKGIPSLQSCSCVSNIRVSNLSSQCVPPATIRTCTFYFYTSERKSFMHVLSNRQPDGNQ